MTWPPPELMRQGMEIPLPEMEAPRTRTTDQQITVRRIPELRVMPDAEVEWLVERFLAKGVITDLVAYIKTGKTTLIAQLIAAVLHGESFLGLNAIKAPVVLLSEERVATLLLALDEARIEDSDELHVLLWNEQRGVPWAQVVGQARAYCEEVGAKLLVIDTLGMWADVDDENLSNEAKTAMIPLLEATVGIATAVLRQARKSGGETHNAGRGSGAYGGAADVLLHLDYTRDDKGKVLEESSKRQLTIRSRLERESVPPMELDYANGRYFTGMPMELAGGAKQAIRDDLARHGEAKPYDISLRTGVARNTIIKTLGRMEEVVSHDGVYRLDRPVATSNGGVAYPGDPIPNTGDMFSGDNPVTEVTTSRERSPVTTSPPPLRGGGGVVVTADAPVPVTRHRHRCPSCDGKAYSAGPGGLPERKCHRCSRVWTPEEQT